MLGRHSIQRLWPDVYSTLIKGTGCGTPKQIQGTDANKTQTQTVSKVQQTQKKKSDATKSEVRKSDKEKSGQKKSDGKKPEVRPSSHQVGGSTRNMVQSSPAPHVDSHEEKAEKLKGL